MSERLTADLAIEALIMALNTVQSANGILFHSDRGVHASHAFKSVLAENGMIQSMSRKACCWDNGVPRIIYFEKEYEIVN